jgi:hypothetical protein
VAPDQPRQRSQIDLTPSARRLTGSLRDIGYDFQSALADVIDNSVTAGASRVDVDIVFRGRRSYVAISDNGTGMTERELHEALRFGSRRDYEIGELGRYGLGLKTASISQCRCVTVMTRHAPQRRWISELTLDLGHIEATDRWEVTGPPEQSVSYDLVDQLWDAPGTVVVWEDLDRVLPGSNPDGGWARRRLDQLADRASTYLGMVFHRFLEGTADRAQDLVITVNGEKVEPWNPFAPLEEARTEMQPLSFEVPKPGGFSSVHLRRYVLPPKGHFSSLGEFERLSGPQKWNRQQGLYIYRADRLIQHGGWSGIRAMDEHTKLARAALDFPTDLDTLFQINVAKMRVSLPPEVKTLLERPLHEVCHRADAAYRGDAESRRTEEEKPDTTPRASNDARELGAALVTAALNSGEQDAFMRVMANLREANPQMASALGW